MRPYRKGQTLIALVDSKINAAQREIANLQSEMQRLIAEMKRCEEEILAIGKELVALEIHDASVTKADIYLQRRHQTVLMHQRQQLRLDCKLLRDQLSDLDENIKQIQKKIVALHQKEQKFQTWVQRTRSQWLAREDATVENDTQDLCVLKK